MDLPHRAVPDHLMPWAARRPINEQVLREGASTPAGLQERLGALLVGLKGTCR
jgi:hypothetical protein